MFVAEEVFFFICCIISSCTRDSSCFTKMLVKFLTVSASMLRSSILIWQYAFITVLSLLFSGKKHGCEVICQSIGFFFVILC